MPEGHTIHRLARRHADWFSGQPVAVSSPQGRFEGADLVDGHTFRDASAWGKHLFHHYDGGVVHVHLGLFGKFFTHTAAPPEPRATCRMRVSTPDRTVDLVGAITCELLTPGEVDDVTAGLGPDPLRDDADPDAAWAALQRRRVGIGRALLDQAVLAGIGNVFRAEVLFTHGLHPDVPANEVSHATWLSMWGQLRTWLRHGVRSGRIVTTARDLATSSEASEQVARDLATSSEASEQVARDLATSSEASEQVARDEVATPRSRTTRDESRYVYKQETCRRCGTTIRRWDLAGRWAYACEWCQPRP